jgi:hypothetical protein
LAGRPQPLTLLCRKQHSGAAKGQFIGRVLPSEAIATSPAQRCCQKLLDAPKHEAPFWKRQFHSDGISR